ncbi:MAG TPA: hypothetical protein VEZ55_05540 [Chitinophagaceae bacterium]|jgi:hypothetical protein|nr:hypothetical protein [Chitinophagaceae bacterium]
MKKSVLILMMLCAIVHAFGQDASEEGEEKKGFSRDKLFVGGNFGLSFGTYTLINVSPQIGYRFNKHFAAGTGVNLQYVSLKERFSNGNLFRKSSQGVVGLNMFGRVYPIQHFMLQVQPEANYVFGKEIYYDSNPRQEYTMDAQIVPSLLLGGGLVLPAGRGATIISLFYDVLQNENSPYSNRPIFNFTFNVGL